MCVQLKGSVASDGVDPIVVGKLSEGQPISPVVLVVAHKDTEVGLDLLMDMFHLTIGL